MNDLRSKLNAARDMVKKKQEAIDTLNTRIAALKNKISDLEGYHADVQGFDTIEHNTKESMDRFFSSIDNHDPYIMFGAALKNILLEHDVDCSGKTVVDFGTGPGIALKAALEGMKPDAVTGYDFSKAALEFAQEFYPEAQFGSCDIYEGDGKQYDVVICTEVLEHLEHPETALKTLVEMIAPDGKLVISVPDGRIDRSKYHVNFWSPESWEIFLKTRLPGHKVVVGVFKIREDTMQQHNYAVISAA